jgi:hypothetical protein
MENWGNHKDVRVVSCTQEGIVENDRVSWSQLIGREEFQYVFDHIRQ